MDNRVPSIRTYRPDIDGIRALAVLSVFLFHLQPGLLPGGFLGVDIFFVISGYLITGIILREHHLGTFSFVHFYARRVKRIFPALFVVLLLSALVAIFLLPPETYLNFMKSARYAAAQLANIFFSREVSYFDEGFAGQPLLHTWSLGVEEQFYLFWPPLIFACFLMFKHSIPPAPCTACPANSELKLPETDSGGVGERERLKTNKKIAVLFLLVSFLSFTVCNILAVTHYNLAFYMFYTRAIEFCIGGFISLGVLRGSTTRMGNVSIGMLGILMVGYSFFFVEEDYFGRPFLHFGVLIPCIGTALMILADSSQSVVNRALALKLPNAIGKISYSLYLYHWPIIIFWKAFNGNQEIGVYPSLLIVLVAFSLSILSYFLVEQPARKSKMPDRRVLLMGAVVIIIFATTFNNLESHSTSGWRITRYDNDLPRSPRRYAQECTKIKQHGLLYFSCQEGDDSSTPIIALAGDSHSPHYLRSTTEWAVKNGYNVKFLGTAGCPIVSGDMQLKSSLGEKHEQECEEALPLFKSEILDDDNVKLILLAHRFDLFYDGREYSSNRKLITFKDPDGSTITNHTEFYYDLLSQTAKQVGQSGKKLIILKQVPIFNNFDACTWEPLLNRLLQTQRRCEFDEEFLEKWQQPSIDFIDAFAATHGIDVIDPIAVFSNPVPDGQNVYDDRDHLNNFGVNYLVPHFEHSLNKILTTNREN